MERLTRLCQNTENGKFAKYTACNYVGVYPNDTLGKVVERLAYYENLEEDGRLIILSVDEIYPCKHCNAGWASISLEECRSCHDDCEILKQYYDKYNH